MLLGLQVILIGIEGGEPLAAHCAVGGSDFVLLLCYRPLGQDSLLEVLSSDRRHVSDFTLQVVPVPVGFVMGALNVAVPERHTASDARVGGHY